jgi:type 1 fimbriae regulatory protein FimB/type 1 fimbriae regulatory protein FimE
MTTASSSYDLIELNGDEFRRDPSALRKATLASLAARAAPGPRLNEHKAAKMAFGVHPHMLRHACGFKLANQGVDTRSLQHYLGHKNIQHTVRYTEVSPGRFRNFWKD